MYSQPKMLHREVDLAQLCQNIKCEVERNTKKAALQKNQ